VWTIRYLENRTSGRAERGSAAIERVIAIGVLSYCVPRCRLRERFFHIEHFSYKQHCRFVNQNLRIISRVIVHPQFRSLGLSTILVRHLCKHCPTRYVESIAMMARAHPFFENAGMTRIDPDDPRQPVYFIFDRRHASV
ncbi:MAG TPA: GNAT family N-acetyltransferase, partial [Tepidisphaeraceae bacterium]|nr:GNAT family N-acetyltransferase [Tepidisphaeraceae bacterium]